jgi:amino acid adenylation domain-containing protein
MFGATVSGRPADLPGVETMVGLFINTVPVRVRIDPARPLGDWLAELQRDQLDAAQYAYAPLVDIHAWSDLPPGRGAFDSILVFENYPADAFQRHYTGEADVTRRPARALRGAGVEHVETTHYPLVVLVNDGAELTLRLSYDPGVFGDRAIAQLLEHFARVLASMPSSARVGDLQVLSDDERRDVLRGSGDGDAQPSHELVDAPFARQVSATPNAVAVVDGPTTLSYRELDARINQLARELRTRGVGPEARVGVCLPPSVDRVATLVAIVRAGGAYVPLDPRYPRERLAAIVDDASPALVIVDGAVADRLPPVRVPMVSIENARAAAERRSSDALAPLASPANAVYIIYTSGSTGRPKGVVLTHECLGNLLRWHTRSLPSRAPVLQYASLSFDVSFHEIFSALACGAAIVAAPEDTRTDVRALAETIRRHRIGKVTLPPIVLEQLALEQAFEPDALRSLEHVIATGEALRPSAPVTELFARLSGCRLHNHYGPSETHLATVSTLPAHVSDWLERPPIGTPIANARTYVLGPDLELVPTGGVG